MRNNETVRIGSRASPLALTQAQEVVRHLGRAAIVVPISTLADRRLDRSLGTIGGKGLFTKELEQALLEGAIDIAVHSIKDMATHLPEPFAIGCVLPRADARDAFISNQAASLRALPQHAHVGTASLRRQAYVQAVRPDIAVSLLRGNVHTRLEKMRTGEYDATFLAMAGLHRTGLANEPFVHPIDIEELIPAPAQGAIGVECLVNRVDMMKLLAPLNHQPTALCIAAERAFLRQLDGSCQTAIGCHVVLNGPQAKLVGCLYREKEQRVRLTAPIETSTQAQALGVEAANTLMQWDTPRT